MMLTEPNTSMPFKAEYTSSIYEKAFQAIEALKGRVDAHDLHVVSFLIYLHKEGVLVEPRSLSSYELQNIVDKLVERLIRYNTDQNHFLSLYSAFRNSLGKIAGPTLKQTLAVVESIDIRSLNSSFGVLMEELVYYIARSEGRKGGEYLQPFELTQLICKLADLPQGAKVYNPFAGLASFGVCFDSSIDYLGQEINKYNWAIGLLRLIANNKISNSVFINQNSISEWNPNTDKYDLIVANPPFGMRVERQQHGLNHSLDLASFLTKSSISNLSSNGKAIIVVPNGFLFSMAGERNIIRRFLVSEDLLDTIISFPGGLLMNTSIPFSVLVINNDKKYKGKVLFVDASTSVKEGPRRERKLDVERLLHIISVLDNSETRIISSQEIKQNDFVLTASRYLIAEVPGVPLEHLIRSVSTTRVKEDVVGKFISIKNLKSDKLNFNLSTSEIENVLVPRKAFRLERSALLLTTRWKTLKPTLFEYKGEPLFISPEIAAFEINEKLVDKDYLVYELNSDYVTNQLNRYRTSTTIPFISKNDLLQVKIDLPTTLEEQKAEIKGAKETLFKFQMVQAERNALAHGVIKKQFDEFASLKHTLGAPRQNILSYSEALVTFFENNQSSSFKKVNQAFAQALGEDMVSVFKAIKNDISFISELLEKGEKGFVLQDYNLDSIPLVELQNVVNEYKSTTQNFKLIVRSIKIDNKESLGIVANKTLFKALFDNLLSNAQKHGFDKKEADNQVVVDLSVIENVFIVDIKNNGKPFPKNFNKDKFIAKFSTADANNGSGLGGYDINRIVDYFGGTWDLTLNEDIIYPVRFTFQFPLIIMK